MLLITTNNMSYYIVHAHPRYPDRRVAWAVFCLVVRQGRHVDIADNKASVHGPTDDPSMVRQVFFYSDL